MVMIGNATSTIIGNGSRRDEPQLVSEDHAEPARRHHARLDGSV